MRGLEEPFACLVLGARCEMAREAGVVGGCAVLFASYQLQEKSINLRDLVHSSIRRFFRARCALQRTRHIADREGDRTNLPCHAWSCRHIADRSQLGFTRAGE
jgi:hypothetical protein